MMELKALRIRIYPNVEQTTLLNKTFGCSRFIYNTMLAERKDAYEKLKDKPRELYEHKYRTEKQLKEEFEFLKEVDSISLQQTRMNFGVAYENFFRKLKNPKIPSSEKGFPKFKKKNSRNSFRTITVGNNLKIDFQKKKIKAPRLGWISYRDNRKIDNIKIHNMTFLSLTRRWVTSGSFMLNDFEGNTINAGAGWKRLALVKRSTTLLTERRRCGSSHG